MANKISEGYTLGLDVGMASVGAALLTDQRIAALHVRTFDKAETAKEGDSLNLIRRQARLTRRRLRRRAFRLLRLCRLLKRQGLIEKALPETFANSKVSPWQLRAEALDRLLTGPELAAALYHLVKHRGFQSNRKSEASADEKAGQMLKGVSANRRLLAESGLRSVGELAARHPAFAAAKRNKGGDYSHTFDRSELVSELAQIFKRQREHGSALVSAEFEAAVLALLLARKPTLSGENLLKMIGKCTLEPEHYRAPKACYSVERFVWLSKLNNLRIEQSGDSRALEDGERLSLLNAPFSQAKLTFKQARKLLDLPATARFNLVNYRVVKDGPDKAEDATLFEAKAFHALRKAYEAAGLKSQWQRDALNPARLNELAYAQSCFKDDKESRAYLSGLGVEGEVIEAVLNVSFDAFVQLSLEAIDKLLPFLERGQRYDEAAHSAGYHHSQSNQAAQVRGYLPAPDKNVIRNPVVYRALNQARKLINALVREYGPPKAVHIELARDLSKPFDERRQIERDQKAFQEEKSKARNSFIELFGTEPKALDLLKRRLYEEQGGKCAYSLAPIDLQRLTENSYVEVDHALPYSRSFDDSQNNKVLVLTAENRNKGNRTPYEYLDGASESPRWLAFESWVNSTKTLRQAKRQRLLRKHFGQDEAQEFRDRNLNDTRYICRELKTLVEQHLQWHPEAQGSERCVVVAGQLTALLRARWGLIKIRADGDKHHALDAAVIAAANRSLVKRMADYSRRKELQALRGDYIDPETGEVLDLAGLRRIEEHFPEPWPHFWAEVKGRLSDNPAQALREHPNYPSEILETLLPLRVSRAPTRRGLGAAHQETIRSRRTDEFGNQNKSAVKTALSALTLKDLPAIVGAKDQRNTELIRVIRERLEAFGGDGKKAFAPNQPPLLKPSQEGKAAPIVRSVKLLAVQKSGLPVRGGIANNGDMLRADIFSKGGKFYAVPVYVADAARGLPNRAIVAAKDEREWPVMDETYLFLFSFYPNDWVRVTLKGEVREGYYSGVHRGTGNISFWIHDRDQAIGKKGMIEGTGIKTALAVEKFHVDYLGRLHKVHQESRQPILGKKNS